MQMQKQMMISLIFISEELKQIVGYLIKLNDIYPSKYSSYVVEYSLHYRKLKKDLLGEEKKTAFLYLFSNNSG